MSKTSLTDFSSMEELIEFFNNPIVKKQMELTKSNAEKTLATSILKENIAYYIKLVDCKSLLIE